MLKFYNNNIINNLLSSKFNYTKVDKITKITSLNIIIKTESQSPIYFWYLLLLSGKLPHKMKYINNKNQRFFVKKTKIYQRLITQKSNKKWMLLLTCLEEILQEHGETILYKQFKSLTLISNEPNYRNNMIFLQKQKSVFSYTLPFKLTVNFNAPSFYYRQIYLLLLLGIMRID